MLHLWIKKQQGLCQLSKSYDLIPCFAPVFFYLIGGFCSPSAFSCCTKLKLVEKSE